MKRLKNYLIIISVISFVIGCKSKRPSLSGDEPVKISDFIDFFELLDLPFQFDDALLNKKGNDSLIISYKVFTQFIPDSLLSFVYGKGVKPQIYAMGKVAGINKVVYLFVKTSSGEKKTAFVLCFDKRKKFIAGMPVMQIDKDVLTMQSAGLDKSFSIIKAMQKKNKDGGVSEGKDVYVLNEEEGRFILILTDPLNEKMQELINPIDTLAKKNKLSGDYFINKKNMVSIRDGRKSDRLLFFIHFENSNGECSGELKGEALFKSPKIAEYHANGNLCALRFTFTTSSVTIQEIEACGSYRGVRCVFEGTYPRKKETKPKPDKKTSATKK